MESQLIDDDVLRGMLAELAESVEVPPSGAASALAALRSGGTVAQILNLDAARARRKKRLGTMVGVAAAVVIVAGVAVAGSHDDSGSDSKSAASVPALAYSGTSSGASTGTASSGAGESALTPQSTTVQQGTSAAAAGAPVPAAGAATTSGLAARTPASAPSAAASVPSVDADRVIRTGDVNLTVPKGTVPATVTKLEGAATGLAGFLQDSNTQQADPKSGGIPTASVTLRVPAPQFGALLTRVQALGKVLSSTTTGKDVTAQYVDLAARLKALETSRSTYLTILSQAKTVNDTLSVQQRLDDIQQQIEQLQGQQNALGAQSDLATLTVEVSEPAPAPAPTPVAPTMRSGLSAAFHTAGDRFRRGSEAVIAALGTIALLLIAGLGLLIVGRIGWRVYLRRTV